MPPKLISKNYKNVNSSNNELIFFVNGKKVIEKNPDPECTLLTYLRETLRLCGTKLGCAEGGCGACTVMLSEFNRYQRRVTHRAVNACITPLCRAHGCAIVTVEGIGSTKTKLHPVQERIARAHGSQCGFCTPGIVMSMYSLLRNSPTPTMKDLEMTFQGNLCRCTGYRPIIEGYRTFTKEYNCSMGGNCCKNSGKISSIKNGNSMVKEELFKPSEFSLHDPTQEPIFPPELKISNEFDSEFLIFRNSKRDVTWYRPIALQEVLKIKHENPNAKLVNGNTEVGIEVKFKKFKYSILIMPNLIHDLIKIEIGNDGVRFGASVTLDDMNETLNKLINTLPEYQTRLFKCIVNMLHYFAGKQVRNVASVGGNIMTGSPISDLIPIFTAAEIELEVESYENGCRKVHMDDSFFIGYRKNILNQTEILKSIFIPISQSNQYLIAYKQAKRREDDIAIVNFALNVTFSPNTNIIKNINLAFGGMAPTVVMASKTSEKLIGKCWNTDIIEIVNNVLSKEIPLSPSAPGGMIHYRQSLTLSLFFKGYLQVYQELEHNAKVTMEQIIPTINLEKSGANVFHSLVPKSVQFFERDITNDIGKVDVVGQPRMHVAAFKQVCGEAVYCDDIPKYENELYLGFVLSTKSHAKIIDINASEAEQLEGVHLFLSGKDIGEEENKVGPVFHDEELFRRNTVTSYGQIIGVIVADDQRIAQRACGLVKVTYENLLPVILTIEDAIREKSFFPGERSIVKGDVDEAFRNAEHIVEGDCRMGGQEHFYLETHAAIAVPRENDELELICSVQHPSEIQKLVSHVTGLPASHVVTRVKRMGGGFGGKESRGLLTALPVALAAHRMGRPVRCMLDRDEDMVMTGTRHPFYLKYKASCDSRGKITGCDIEIYNNAGYSVDLSFSILERAMFHFENAYFIPNVRVKGWACRTNLPSNTAFRGFGGPQGMFAGEHIIRDIARIVGKDEIEVAALNLYREGQLTHYNQELINCNLIRCWDECFYNSDYVNRKLSIEQFNKNNRWRKRGISMVSTKFGIAFTALFLNQAGALVHVYGDGSVLLSHGGTEMGQGLHTKMIQVASRALNIPPELIHISETSTDKVPNTSATAASAGSDLNGMAVLNACNTLMERLNPYREKYPDEGWKSWIGKAYMDRVSLSATGFYATPNIGYDFQTNSGNPFNYFTYGAACSEVEIDCLTGDHQVIRSDIVMDLGTSINPAIDIGQIEGGFTQGYGLFTLEEMVYASNGTVLSKGPGVYKIPGFADIPGEFNVSLLKGASNPRAVYSSKAVGEPPLFLASSIFFAIKEAIAAARKDENLSDNFKLNAPATAERIRMACEDKFTNQFKLPPTDSYIPWNIIP